MRSADYIILTKRITFALLIFALSRVGFYFYNFSYFEAASLSETIWAFFYGLRFDLSTVLIANLFFILAAILPYRPRWYGKFLKALFVISNTVYLSLIFGDYEYFAFTGKKLTYDLLMIGSDFNDQAPQLIANYWHLTLLTFFTAGLVWKFYPMKGREVWHKKKIALYKSIPISILFFVLTAIGVRGGLQLRSISPKEAFVFKTYELGNFALNSAYSFIRSFGNKGAKKVSYFSTDKEAFQKLKDARTFSESEISAKGSNVVIIIVESLSQEYVNQGYAPFIKELSEKGLYFETNFANGRRSMEALPSIMTSFPSILGSPIYQTQYQSNKFHALPKILKENGYKTTFYHGGKKGTMDFDAYCYSIGFDEYHALEDYPNKDHFDGTWGVYDHHYLEHFGDKIDDYKNPFFAGVFTLSSHQPYSIPASLKGKFPKGELPIHESIGYADYSLRNFFQYIKDKEWFKNTLFIVTADHTQKLTTKEFQSILGRYRVPLIFYHPQVDLRGKSKREVTQHVDILPSVLDLLDIQYPKKLYYGASVFNDSKGRMLNFNSGSYFLLKENKLISFDGSNAKFFDTKADFLNLSPSNVQESSLLEELKAIIQYTNNGLRNNNIYSLDQQ